VKRWGPVAATHPKTAEPLPLAISRPGPIPTRPVFRCYHWGARVPLGPVPSSEEWVCIDFALSSPSPPAGLSAPVVWSGRSKWSSAA